MLENDNFVTVNSMIGPLVVEKFNFAEIKSGLEITKTISKILNDPSKIDEVYEIFSDKPAHHIEYLKSKLYPLGVNGKFSAGEYLSYRRIPEVDRQAIVNFFCPDKKMHRSINMASCFIRACVGIISYLWISECFNLQNTELDNESCVNQDRSALGRQDEYAIYSQLDLDAYLCDLSNEKLQLVIDKINENRIRDPNFNELNGGFCRMVFFN